MSISKAARFTPTTFLRGALRGFGVTQTCFAMESNLNLLAREVGISPWEIRFRNAIEPGGVLSNGQIADEGTALKETLLAVKDVIDAHPDAGIACAFKNTGKGVGVKDVGRVKLKVENGRVVICTSAACMGQGIATVVLQIVAEATGLDKSLLTVHAPDTDVTPDSGTSTASRQTTVTGEAARRAANVLKAGTEPSRARGARRRGVLRRIRLRDRSHDQRQAQPREPCCLRIRDPGCASR